MDAKNPFDKHNSGGNPEPGQEIEPEAAKDSKKKTKLKISFKNILSRKPENGEQAEAAAAAKAEKAAAKAEKAAEKARKKEEKRLAKENKKKGTEESPAETGGEPPVPGAEAAPAETKKKKKEKPEKIKDGEKKKPPVLLFSIIGVVVVGGAVAAFLLFGGGGGPSVEDRLMEAARLAQEGSYEESTAIYQELLGEDEMLVDAYLGEAANQVLQSDVGGAISILSTGYGLTQDASLEARIQELTPAEEEAPTEPPVTTIVWQDKALEQMVRMAMGRTDGSDITTADAAQVQSLKIVGGTHAVVDDSLLSSNALEGYTIDGTFYADRGGIKSLEDLRYFTGLTKLTVSYNQVEDIGGLEALGSLVTLCLYCNDISDLTPLSGLANLKYLYLYNNQISDLSALSGLTGLSELYLQDNRITGVAPLGGLTGLKKLYLNGNAIEDLSPIATLKELRQLYVRNNQVADFSPIWGLPSLSDVAVDGNPAENTVPPESAAL